MSQGGGSTKRPGEKPAIDSLYVALGINADGDEGILGFQSAEGWMPLVSSTRAGMAKIEPMARAIADHSGETVRFVRFERGRQIREFKPRPRGQSS